MGRHMHWQTSTLAWVALLFSFSSNILLSNALMISDEDRKAGYAARNYTWPVRKGKIIPNTPGWDLLMRKRMRQMEAVETDKRFDKYDGWKSVMGQALVVPNYTQFGWGVSQGPQHLVQEIQETLRANMHTAYGEGDDPAIVGPEAVMVDMQEVIDRALLELHPYFEAWAGVPLRPLKAYGLRLYRDTSQLYMHLDKMQTHVISGILHIDRSVDAKPWPLVIEDFEGTTQSVYLNMGDLLFYESAKCLHGRPTPFEGGWYTSLFLHYAPIEWLKKTQDFEAQYAIPDHWEEVRPYDKTAYNSHGMPPQLNMVDTAMMEPHCPNQWCGSHQTSSWEGPAKPGIAISSHGVEQALHLEVDANARNEL